MSFVSSTHTHTLPFHYASCPVHTTVVYTHIVDLVINHVSISSTLDHKIYARERSVLEGKLLGGYMASDVFSGSQAGRIDKCNAMPLRNTQVGSPSHALATTLRYMVGATHLVEHTGLAMAKFANESDGMFETRHP